MYTKKILFILITVSAFLNAAAQSYVPLQGDTRMQIQPRIEIKAYSVPLTQVRLLDSPFKTAMEAAKKRLMDLQPDRFLHRFHLNAGFTPKAPIYEGWENSTQSGFCFGHYLSGMSLLYAATGDVQVLAKIEYCINELKKCQDARGTGYVDAIPDGDKLWNDVVAGKIEANTGWLNGIWVPWYNLHKLWAGLTDVYLYTGNETAKTIVINLTDWACDKFAPLTEAQWQQMIYCETGGINDALYNVYAITGDPKHLQLADKFYHKLVLDPLSQQQDRLAGLHANTQIPKITGAARAYELLGDEKNQTITDYFWETVTRNRTYCIGGNSDHEHFGESRKLTLSNQTTETCNTYNMLKLTRHLFARKPEAKYMDYYERALYNHILASQNPNTGMVVYYLPLAYNSKKDFSTPEHSFWCCVGTGFENHVKYAESIYSENENELWVNLFIPSQLNWERQNVTITQQTTFPDSDKSEITIKTSSPKELTFHIRYPEWVGAGYAVKINGEKQMIGNTPGTYISLTRIWNNDDKIEIEISKSLRKELLLGDEHKTAYLNGPIVLAGETKTNEKPIIFLDRDNVGDLIKPVNENNTEFRSETGYPANLNLIPFYKKQDGYYAVYFDTYSAEEWDAVKEKYEKEEEEERELERLTLDYFRPNEQQQEIDHKFQGTNVGRGDGASGKKWCDSDGGYFSFEMKVNPKLPADLILTYWGSDGGGRKFDILINDEVIAVEELIAHKPNEFFDRKYIIPYHLTEGKSVVTVKLRAYSGNRAGGIFFARVVLKKEMSSENVVVTDYLYPKSPYLSQHNFQTDGSSGTHKGHPWVDSRVGGKLSFKMKGANNKPMYLLISYWGGEGDRRKFNILVENTQIAVQELYMDKPEETFDVLYEIPVVLTEGKDMMTVSLVASNTSKAGGVFYAYTFSNNQLVSITSAKDDENIPFIINVKNKNVSLINKRNRILSGTVKLFFNNGQLFYSQYVNLDKEVVLTSNLNEGTYILRFEPNTGLGFYSAKFIVS